jgi:rRNA maturation protein Nop10
VNRPLHGEACDNMNHRRPDAPVSHCPQCGGVVNARIPAQACSTQKHDAARRRQSVFCVDCGTQLVGGARH